MAANILITGGSGYLGGDLLQELKNGAAQDLPPHGTIYALVRSDEQAAKVRQHYGVEPIFIDLADEETVTATLLEREISIVFWLINVRDHADQLRMVRALQKVQEKTGRQTHLVQTAGAKLFSSHTGHPTDHTFTDDDPDLYEIHKAAKSEHPDFQLAMETDCTILETAGAHGVRAYVFAPCIVYGKSLGFGKPISKQTTSIVQVAKALRKVIRVDEGEALWPVCHVHDNTTLYIQMLHKMLAGETIGHNRKGFYLASPGRVAWEDIYKAMGESMVKRGVIDQVAAVQADDTSLKQAAEALGCSKEWVSVEIGGKSTWTPQHGKSIGWKPKYAPEHILEAADEEVERILKNL